MAPLLLITGIPILSIVIGAFQKEKINVFLMGFFRDLGRIKANKRKQASNAVTVMNGETITTWDILFGRDDPLAGVDFLEEECNGNDCTEGQSEASYPTFTAKELEEFGSGLDGTPIYLSVFGRVYDVSKGSKFYGEGASYSMFAGKDVTRALCLGCKQPECLVRSTDGLTEDQINEGKRWLSFFHLHDKYNFVGKMESLDSEAWLDALIEEAISQKNDGADGGEDDDETQESTDTE